ncbi:aminopeptidase N-like [Aphis craccivora]|uniref:Aminopeptidase N n=1 Tax=Aphis craccivora TaxID=307492 RepID=A0A6G0Z3N6_APHCR|nr:aminopeptidase N-like [Aphis craccivora]
MQTQQENILLNNLDEDSIEKIESVAEVIAHELAHQWFGNLVTMKWWSDIWLNEGFATYVGIRGVDFLYPEWNSFQVKTLLNFLTILREDSLQSSHPLSVADRNSNEIQEIFDVISYKKGASLLHMMNMFLGENTFKQSIRNYIKKYKFSNADQNDLWSSFTEEAHRQGTLDKNLTVKLIMDTWTLKAGYPILKVVRNYSAETVTLSQERFLRSKSDDIDNNTCWWIPLSMTTSMDANFNQTIPKSWLDCENNNLTIPLAKDNAWVIYNLQMAGLFRILYDTRNWMGIISTLNDPNEYKTIHTLNRVQLIDDSFTFSHNGNLDYGITFQLLNYLKHENEYAPWMTALDGLNFITEIMKRTPNQGVFQNLMRRLLLPVYSRFQNMTTKYNSFEETRFKNLVIAEACRHEIKDCTKQALDLFRKWMKTTDPDKNNILPRELKPVIYCQAIKYGGVDEWDFLWERYQRSNVDSEKEELISTLGCSSETWLLNRYLNWSLDDSIFRTQDTISVFYSVAKGDIGFYVAKDFLYRRWVDISKYFKSLGNIPRKYISIIGFEMKTIQELNEMESFMNKSENNLGGVVQIVGDMNNKPPVFEYIRVNIEGMLEFYHKIYN